MDLSNTQAVMATIIREYYAWHRSRPDPRVMTSDTKYYFGIFGMQFPRQGRFEDGEWR